LKELKEARERIREMEETVRARAVAVPSNTIAAPKAGDGRVVHQTAQQEACDRRFGKGLLDDWFSNPVTVCGGGETEITCYTHKHPWRDDVQSFCVGKNVELDFSKITGRHSTEKKPPRGRQMYPNFEMGALTGDCRKTADWGKTRFMPHADLAMKKFQEGKVGGGTVEEEPTYLLARDEDSENAFHSTADFINMHMLYEGLGLSSANVILFDLMPDGPYKEMIEKAYGGGKTKRKEDYNAGKVLFRNLVFHLESPAGIIFPKIGVVGGKKQLDCRDSYLWHGYRERVLRAFSLWDVPPPRVPSVSLILRKRTPSKNVGRIMSNEKEIEGVLKECTLCETRVLDLAEMTYREQLEAIRNTNILVGVHGAGLMNVVFAAEEAILIEIHPHYRLDRHFRIASKFTGKTYMPMRTTSRVTCNGSSDNVPVPADVFRDVLDGAVRLARSFDDGISECGLKCEGGILSLDEGREDMYAKLGVRKETRPNTKFPCG